MTKRTLYLANDYGFSGLTSDGPLRRLATVLESLGAEVREPSFASADAGESGPPQWACRIGRHNVDLMRRIDGGAWSYTQGTGWEWCVQLAVTGHRWRWLRRG